MTDQTYWNERTTRIKKDRQAVDLCLETGIVGSTLSDLLSAKWGKDRIDKLEDNELDSLIKTLKKEKAKT